MNNDLYSICKNEIVVGNSLRQCLGIFLGVLRRSTELGLVSEPSRFYSFDKSCRWNHHSLYWRVPACGTLRLEANQFIGAKTAIRLRGVFKNYDWQVFFSHSVLAKELRKVAYRNSESLPKWLFCLVKYLLLLVCALWSLNYCCNEQSNCIKTIGVLHYSD